MMKKPMIDFEIDDIQYQQLK